MIYIKVDHVSKIDFCLWLCILVYDKIKTHVVSNAYISSC